MKKLPVIETTKYAYKFFFANFGKFFPLLLQYSGVYLFFYMFLHLIKNDLNLSMEGPTGIFASCIFDIVDHLAFWLVLPIEINIARTVVNGEGIEKHFFRSFLSSRTWRVTLAYILSYLLIAGPLDIILWLIEGWSSVLPSFDFQGVGYNNFTITLFMCSFFLLIYVGLRLSLSITHSALDHPQPIKHSWKMTKSSFLRILAIFILTMIPFLLSTGCLMLIFEVSNHSNPLGWGLIWLPGVYLSLLFCTALGRAYMHLNKSI